MKRQTTSKGKSVEKLKHLEANCRKEFPSLVPKQPEATIRNPVRARTRENVTQSSFPCETGGKYKTKLGYYFLPPTSDMLLVSPKVQS